jgi:hypothetical protein
MNSRSTPRSLPHTLSRTSLVVALLGAVLAFRGVSSCAASDDQRQDQQPPKEVQKLNESRQWELDVGEARALDLPAQPRTQIITFEFSSKGEVSALVFKEEDAKRTEGLLDADSKKALVRVQGRSGKTQVEVPAKTATRFVLRGVNAATVVDVKLTNQPDTRESRIDELERENNALKKEVTDLKRQLEAAKKPEAKK